MVTKNISTKIELKNGKKTKIIAKDNQINKQEADIQVEITRLKKKKWAAKSRRNSWIKSKTNRSTASSDWYICKAFGSIWASSGSTEIRIG